MVCNWMSSFGTFIKGASKLDSITENNNQVMAEVKQDDSVEKDGNANPTTKPIEIVSGGIEQSTRDDNTENNDQDTAEVE